MYKLCSSIYRWARHCWQLGLVCGAIAYWCLGMAAPSWSADLLLSALAQGNAITDPNAILRYALPIDNPSVRKLQASLEDISNHIRAKRWPPIAKDVREANYILKIQSDKILAGVSGDRQEQAQMLLENIKTEVEELLGAVEAKDREQVMTLRSQALEKIGSLEQLMVQGFPYQVPAAYSGLPQLKGRATVEVLTTQGPLTVIVDGYSAPINGGNFVDLVQRRFYDGLPFSRTEDNFVVQTGDPIGPEEGFIDPQTKKYRAVPLEVLVKGEAGPIYGETLEEAGLYLPELALPFNAFGAVALARPDTEPNGGSSQFFFFKFDSELTPPGFNLMDGRYSVFGYVVEGKETLDKLTDQDKIISAQVISGTENLQSP